MLKAKQNLFQGFTLVELLVAVFIIGTISALILVSYRASEQSNTLRLATQRLVSDLNYARNLTLSGQKTDFPTGSLARYGVDFTADEYTIYADKNNNSSLDSGEGIKTVKLPHDIIFSSSHSPFVFGYLADDVIQINVVSACSDNIILTLKSQSGSQTSSITIDCQTGQIDF